MRVLIYLDDDRELSVEVDYSPGTADVPYLSNGDPGYPGDPEEINIIAAEVLESDIWVEYDIEELTEGEAGRIFEGAAEQYEN